MKEIPLTFKNREGGQLMGISHIPDKTPAPVAVLIHGWRNLKSESHRWFVRLARKLCEEGFVVYRFDLRCSGDSYGEIEDMTLSGEINDIKDIIEFVKNRSEVNDKVFVVGTSFGSYGCICAELNNINALVLCGSAVDFKEPVIRSIAMHHKKSAEEIYESIKNGEAFDLRGNLITPDFINDVGKWKPLEHIKKIKVPILFIHGEKDQYNGPENSKKLFELANEPKEIKIIKNSLHSFEEQAHKNEVIDLILDWFKKYL